MSEWLEAVKDYARVVNSKAVNEKICPVCHSEFERYFAVCPYDQAQLVEIAVPEPVLDGRFCFESKLGRGAIADVYSGMDQKFDRPVVVKVLRNQLECSPESWRKLRKELIVASVLNHENTSHIFTFGSLQGAYQLKPYIVTDLLDGVVLPAAFEHCGECPLPHSINLAKQLVSAVSYAHSMGVIHGDIKPGNVRITCPVGVGAHCYLVDFAFSFRYFSQSNPRKREIGMPAAFVPISSIPCLAPELIAGGEATQKADMFSLACVLIQLCTGAPPFKAGSLFELAYEHRQAWPPLPSTPSGWPSAVVKAIYQGLEPDPAKRITAMELEASFLNCS